MPMAARCLLLSLLAGVLSGVPLVTDRATGHLALWRVQETSSRDVFARPPSAASGDLDRGRSVALRVMSVCGQPSTSNRVRWASVEDMLGQVRAGAVADCWPRTSLFESFATGAGVDSRVWALEGDGFAGDPHTVPEVWAAEWRRWVMVDPTLNVIARDRDGVPLGVLALRERILTHAAVEYEPIDPAASHVAEPATYYPTHVRYPFLRRHHLLDARDRYGVLAAAAAPIDRLPEPLKKALSAAFGSSGAMLYYHDAHDASLRGRSLAARAVLVTFLVSIAVGLASAVALLVPRPRAVVA